MDKMTIKLDSVDKVKSFSEVISHYEAEADLVSGRYVVDAKSIMGIFSLNLENAIELTLRGEDNAAILPQLKPYLV